MTFNKNFKIKNEINSFPAIHIMANRIDTNFFTNFNTEYNTYFMGNQIYAPNDFNYSIQLWPVIDTKVFNNRETETRWGIIKNVWNNPKVKVKCDWLKYKMDIHKKLHKTSATLPLLSFSDSSNVQDISRMLGYNSMNDEHAFFYWCLYKYLLQPDKIYNFDYENEYKLFSIKDMTELSIINDIISHVKFRFTVTPIIGKNWISFDTYLNYMMVATKDPTKVNPDILKYLSIILIAIYKKLKILENVKISHNYLCDKNILMRKIDDTNFDVIIINYDYSYCSMLGPNPILNMTCNRGFCNFYDYWFDFFRLFSDILRKTRPYYRDIIFGIITGVSKNVIQSTEYRRIITAIQLENLTDTYDRSCWYYNTRNRNFDISLKVKNMLKDFDGVIYRLSMYSSSLLSLSSSSSSPSSSKFAFKLSHHKSKKSHKKSKKSPKKSHKKSKKSLKKSHKKSKKSHKKSHKSKMMNL